MWKWLIMGATCLCFTFVPLQSHAIVWVVVKAAAKKVIKAIDLQVQRLQNKTIALQNAQKAVENTMSKFKLNEISEWVEKQRSQYQQYYDELWKVKNAIAYYKRIKAIVAKQISLVDEYKWAYDLFKQDHHFKPSDISSMGQVYDGILNESVKCIDELLLVINSFATEMTDAQRLAIIAKAGDKIDDNLSDLKKFNRSNALYSIDRAKDANEAMQLKVLYGIDD